jgi:hypothetical protein
MLEDDAYTEVIEIGTVYKIKGEISTTSYL